MAILNYSTKIDSYKTILEIQKVLSKHGANKIVIDNDSFGNPIALTFVIEWNNSNTLFALPCNFTGVLKAMRKSNIPKSFLTEDQALRVGWRIVKDWIEAQMAIIEAELASMAEVFLPYAVTKNGDTLYNYLQSDMRLLLNS